MASSKSKQKLAACSSCRKLKTRCELLDLQSPVRCHRCKKVNIACSYSEMDQTVFLQRQKKPKSTEEVYLAFARAFQDLQAFSLDYSSTPYTWIVGSQNIAVDVLPQRIVDWFEWSNGSTTTKDHNLDWSCPLASIANLQPCYSFIDLDGSLFSPEDASQNIISADKTQELLEIYQQKYGGWLSFAVIEEAHDPLLRLVCCTLAARHLPEEVRWHFMSRLHAMTEKMINTIMSKSTAFPASSTTVKALFVWASWLPVTRNRRERLTHSPGSILSVVIDMAFRLRLDGCEQRLLELRKLEAAGNPVDSNLAAELLDKARLWAWITNVDAVYSLWTGKPPRCSRGPSFASTFPATHTIPTYLDGCQDARIRIVADLLHVTKAALKIQPHSNRSSDLESWLRERRKCLRDLANLQRGLSLFSPLTDFAKRPISQMGVLSRTVQLLVYYDVLYTAWKLYEASPQYKDNPNNPFWCLEIDPSLVDWMKEGLVLAEEILVWAIQVDSDFLVVLPDHLFLYFSFAAVYVMGVKFVGFNALHTVLTCVDCQLLHQVIANLNRAALWSGHPAKSCADFISALLSLWDKKEFLFAEGDSSLQRDM